MRMAKQNGILLKSDGSEFEFQEETANSYSGIGLADNWQARTMYACNTTINTTIVTTFHGAIYQVETACQLKQAIVSNIASATGVIRWAIYQHSGGQLDRDTPFPLVTTFDISLPLTGSNKSGALDFILREGFCIMMSGLASGTSPSQQFAWVNADLGPLNQLNEVLPNSAPTSFITTHSAAVAPPATLNIKRGAGDLTESILPRCGILINFSEST